MDMLKALDNLIDPYNLRARLFPGFLVLLPLGCAVAAWVPIELQALGALGSLAVTLGLATLLQQIVRDAGKQAQVELYRRWGGMPSVRMLSLVQSTVNAQTLARCHAKLRELAPELALPTSVEDETSRQSEALSVYESASDLLLARTRGKEKFSLLFEENMNYGYRRNTWGLKIWGVCAALAGLAACVGRVVTLWTHTHELSTVPTAALVICLLSSTFWLGIVSPIWVRRAADTYAQRLVLSADEIETPPKKAGPAA